MRKYKIVAGHPFGQFVPFRKWRSFEAKRPLEIVYAHSQMFYAAIEGANQYSIYSVNYLRK